MVQESILTAIRNKIQRATVKETAMLGKEKNEIKRLVITLKIQQITEKIATKILKNLSDSEFDKFLEEISHPIIQQRTMVMKQADSVAFGASDNPEEFEKYKKMRRIQERHNKELFSKLDRADLDKKTLQRYLVLLLIARAQDELAITTNTVEYAEFGQAAKIVNDRLGFDDRWLICMALIQLHENLIKKKLSQLNAEMKDDESLSVLISRLSQVIKKKEQRDVTLLLEMSSGLKKIRDIMTHEGYKHKVTKEDIRAVMSEIKKLEKVLYPFTYADTKETKS